MAGFWFPLDFLAIRLLKDADLAALLRLMACFARRPAWQDDYVILTPGQVVDITGAWSRGSARDALVRLASQVRWGDGGPQLSDGFDGDVVVTWPEFSELQGACRAQMQVQ